MTPTVEACAARLQRRAPPASSANESRLRPDQKELRFAILLGRAEALAVGLQQLGVNQRDEIFRGKGFDAERNVEPVVFRFGFRQATQHDHRQFDVEGANLPHQLGAAGAGHQVIGNDQTNAIRQGSKGCKCAFGSGGDGDLEARLPENRFPDLELERVIVDE
jgi:hypothetical protein